MGIMEVTCIKLSLVLHILVTWAAYHDYDHICITPMVDLIFVRWFMRCKDVYVLDVWVDVYVTPFLCACSDQTSMHRVCVGDVCISWSSLVVSLGKWQKSLNCYCFYLSMVASLGRIWDTVHISQVTERTPCLQGCICFQHHVRVLYAILY
jgi:hypothetical protein